MKWSIIGCGNMGKAIGEAVASEKTYNLGIYDIDKEKALAMKKNTGAKVFDSIEELIKDSDYIVIAVKPNVIEKVFENKSVDKSKVYISIAAGKEISFFENVLGNDIKIVRTMPNVNAFIKESMTAITSNSNVTEEEFIRVKEFFGNIGSVMEIEENMFGAFASMAGCSPAYTYLYVDSLARAGLKAGFDKKTALKIASQAVYGSAKLMLNEDRHPWELIDSVCSPGGSTIEALEVLLENSFQSIIMKACEKAIDKDKKMG